ncbi:MAG: lipid-binding SYLF domain-containing protein [Syntrophaceae bacterium]
MQRLMIVLILLVLAPATLAAESRESIKLRDAAEVLDRIMSIPEQQIPPALLSDARGIAVIPGVIKAGFFVGGSFGRGVMSVRTDSGNFSAPVFITLTAGSLGYQFGAQSTDVILVFKSPRSIDAIRHGKFTLGADAAVAAGPVGRSAEAATDIALKAEIYSYSRSRGLFAGVAFQGAAIQVDIEANNAFYGRDVNTDALFKGAAGVMPEEAAKFIAQLARYAPQGN